MGADSHDADLGLVPVPLSDIVIRATDGEKKGHKKVKLSTIVTHSQLGDFFARYQDACKHGLTALRPRDKTKKKKAKARKKKVVVSAN